MLEATGAHNHVLPQSLHAPTAVVQRIATLAIEQAAHGVTLPRARSLADCDAPLSDMAHVNRIVRNQVQLGAISPLINSKRLKSELKRVEPSVLRGGSFQNVRRAPRT